MEQTIEIIEISRTSGKLEILRAVQSWVLSKGGRFTPEELVEFINKKFEEIE